MQVRFREPVIEFMPTAVLRTRWRLRLTTLAIGGTIDTDVEMIIVPPPRPHLGEPAAIRTGLAAQRLLDRRIDENALNVRVFGRGANELGARVRPNLGIDVETIIS